MNKASVAEAVDGTFLLGRMLPERQRPHMPAPAHAADGGGYLSKVGFRFCRRKVFGLGPAHAGSGSLRRGV